MENEKEKKKTTDFPFCQMGKREEIQFHGMIHMGFWKDNIIHYTD